MEPSVVSLGDKGRKKSKQTLKVLTHLPFEMDWDAGDALDANSGRQSGTIKMNPLQHSEYTRVDDEALVSPFDVQLRDGSFSSGTVLSAPPSPSLLTRLSLGSNAEVSQVGFWYVG
jgi:hypothetical protein